MRERPHAIVQARMGSSRLPGKVLRSICGRPMLARLLDRLGRARSIAGTLVATTTDATDDALCAWCEAEGQTYFRGSERDVLERYVRAARSIDAAGVVRITGDCPLIDPEIVDAVVERFRAGDLDYASNLFPPTYPDGLDVEVVTRDALDCAAAEAERRSDREHVTPFIWRNRERFRQVHLTREPSLAELRLTVDHADDLKFVEEVFRALECKQPTFGLEQLLALLHERPELRALNAGHARNESYLKDLAAERQAERGEGARER